MPANSSHDENDSSDDDIRDQQGQTFQVDVNREGSTIFSRWDRFLHKNGKNMLTGQRLDGISAPLNWLHLFAFTLTILLLPIMIQNEITKLPTLPKLDISLDDFHMPLLDTDQFCALRAKILLQNMTSLGFKPMGSAAAEIDTVSLIVSWLEQVQNQSLKSNVSVSKLHFTVDQVNGNYGNSIFMNLTNIIARIDPAIGPTNDSLLVNCHFDSVFESTGASDDGINCAIMLEMIRALMTSKVALKHSVVFMFNDGEEMGLLGGYAFVKGSSKDGGYVDGAGHPWWPQVRAVLNVEAAGLGGHEILFQTGPGPAAPILLEAYASSAVYPFATVIGQELFQSGIIPSTTDFVVFTKFGLIPGFDTAFYSNGYVYHTRYDSFERIADGVYERAGQNYLSLVKHMANSELSAIPRTNSTDTYERQVFFDFFGNFMVVYSFDSVGVAGTILIFLVTISRIALKGFLERKKFAKMFGFMFLAQLLSFLSICGLIILLAYLTGLGKPSGMFWYANPWQVLPIYALPSACFAIAIHGLLFKFLVRRYLHLDHDFMCISAYGASFDAAFLICSLMIIVLQGMGILSSYLIVVLTVWPLIILTINDLTMFLVQKRFSFSNKSSWRWSTYLTLLHCAATLLPAMYLHYIADTMLDVLVPINGRAHDDSNPGFILAAVVALFTALTLLYQLPLVHLAGGNVLRLIIVILLFSASCFVAVLASPAGFPYQVDFEVSNGVRAERSITQLTLVKSNLTNGGKNISSGLWFQPSDYLKELPLRQYSPELDRFFDESRPTCQNKQDVIALQPFCIFPSTRPPTGLDLQHTFWHDAFISSKTVESFKFPEASMINYLVVDLKTNMYVMQFQINCGPTPNCLFHVEFGAAQFFGIRFDMEPIDLQNWQSLVFLQSYYLNNFVRFGSWQQKSDRILYVTIKAKIVPDLFYAYFGIGGQYSRDGKFDSITDGVPDELGAFCKLMPDWHHTTPLTAVYNEFTITISRV